MKRHRDRELEQCPECGNAVEAAHARGGEIVVSPCGHVVGSLTSLEVPPEHRESDG